MTGEGLKFEELADWKATIIFILRRWMWIVGLALIAAVLLGASTLMKNGDPLYTDEEIEEFQSKIDANELTIAKDQADIETLMDANATLQAALDGYQKTADYYTEQLEALQNSAEATQEEADNLISKINSANSSVVSNQNSISKNLQTINTRQKEIDSLTVTNAEQREEMGAVTKVTFSALFKSMVIGAVAGAFIGIVCMLLWYLFYGKLLQDDELSRVYGYPLLGSLYAPKRKVKGLACLLDRWEGVCGPEKEEQELSHIAANIELICGDEPKKLLLTGTMPKEQIDQLREKLLVLLPGEVYTLAAAENPLTCSDTVKILKEYSVVVAEGKRVSKKREIARLASLLRDGHVAVVGAVIL